MQRGIYVSELTNHVVNSGSLSLKGKGVILDQQNKSEIFSNFGRSPFTIIQAGKNDFQTEGTELIECIMIVEGKVSRPMMFWIQTQNSIYNFIRDEHYANKLDEILSELRSKGNKILVDGPNYWEFRD